MSCIFKTQGGGGGMYASIFVTGLSETDRVKAVYQKKAAKIRTGEFIAGQEVPQYIDEYVDGTVKEGVWTSKLGEVETKGHKISRIKDVGTWRVEGTDGEQTVTEDVEVSTAVEYEVEMKMEPNYLMLYDFGDECVDVTGGWTGNLSAYSSIFLISPL